MVHQLKLELAPNHPEAQLAAFDARREDVPRGMSKLAG